MNTAPGTETMAAEGLWGNLNAEDLETPILLMRPHRNLKLSFRQVCALLSSLSWLCLSELAISGMLSIEPLLNSLDRQVSGSC